MNTLTRLMLATTLGLLGGCAAATEVDAPGDAEHDEALPTGKADSGFSACELDAVVLLLNEADVSAAALKAAGVNARAAARLAAARAGADGALGTDDDALFASIEAVDAVPWVGPKTLGQLSAAVADLCEGRGYPAVETIFSPQPWDSSHVVRAEQLIDRAERSVDIAMYSFRVAGIQDALARAVARGVKVRFLFESAGEDRKDPAGTTSAKLEEIGVDVRYVNKIMHHKFGLVDGPQDALTQAVGATLLTGSANWSSSAATRYDENTVVISGAPELALRFQREFNHLWANSRDFVWVDTFTPWTTLPIAEAAIVDDPALDAAFTSANFAVKMSATYGPTFSVVRGQNALADRLVALIEGAERSVWIASGHLRSRPVSEALMLKLAARPDLDVRIYLDGQEFISATSQQHQEDELDACLQAAQSSAQEQSCLDSGYYFSYELHLAGAALRFKHYAYRWHYSYAPQMHHKYVIVDGRVVGSGSYNLSDNAEHNTMENMVFYDGSRFPELVAAFEANFEAMWVTGEAEGSYAALLEEIAHGSGEVPMVYDAMALTWPQVDTLKALIADTCVDESDADHRRYPERHWTCARE